MTKDVKVYIKGTQKFIETGETDVIETEVTGTFYEKGSHSYVIFDEEKDGHKTKTTLKFSNLELYQKKTGDAISNILFKEDYSHEFTYMTPYGPFLMKTETKKFIHNETEKEISMCVKYNMEIDNKPLSISELEIRISAI